MASRLKSIAKLASFATVGLCGATAFALNTDRPKFQNISDVNSYFFSREALLPTISSNVGLPIADSRNILVDAEINGIQSHFTTLNIENIDANVEQHLSFGHQDVDDSAARPNEQGKQQQATLKLKAAIERSKPMIWAKLYEAGIPGLVIAVSVDGKTVWKHGFGYADQENRVLANAATVMRIASISKSITAAAVAKLWENGKIDLDKPVTEYVEAWPTHHQPITTRHLLSHLSGIRHYDREKNKKESTDLNEQNLSDANATNRFDRNSPNSITENVSTKDDQAPKDKEGCDKKAVTPQSKSKDGDGDTRFDEFYLNKKFDSVTESLEIFKNDPLLHEPGSKFHYTTHGFTLLSAVVESATGEKFETHMKSIFKDLGLNNTYLDENEPIIYNRSRYYLRDKNHNLVNAPHVDNSYKWAGGGFLSTVTDLVKFGNAMLYSYQYQENPIQQLSANDTRETTTDDPQETTNLKTKEIPKADRSTMAQDVRTFNISTNEVENSTSDTSEYYKNDHRNFEENESINNCLECLESINALIESQDINLANEYEDDSSITIEDNNDGVS